MNDEWKMKGMNLMKGMKAFSLILS